MKARWKMEVVRAVEPKGREVWWVVVAGGIVGAYATEREAKKVLAGLRKKVAPIEFIK